MYMFTFKSSHGQIPNFVLRELRNHWPSSWKKLAPTMNPIFYFVITLRDSLLMTLHLLLICQVVNLGMAYQMLQIYGNLLRKGMLPPSKLSSIKKEIFGFRFITGLMMTTVCDLWYGADNKITASKKWSFHHKMVWKSISPFKQC